MLICAGGINEREGGWGRKRRGRLPRPARQTTIFDGGAAVSKLFAQIHRHSPDEQASESESPSVFIAHFTRYEGQTGKKDRVGGKNSKGGRGLAGLQTEGPYLVNLTSCYCN